MSAVGRKQTLSWSALRSPLPLSYTAETNLVFGALAGQKKGK